MKYFCSYRWNTKESDGFGRAIVSSCGDPNENTEEFLDNAEEFIRSKCDFIGVVVMNYKKAY